MRSHFTLAFTIIEAKKQTYQGSAIVKDVDVQFIAIHGEVTKDSGDK